MNNLEQEIEEAIYCYSGDRSVPVRLSSMHYPSLSTQCTHSSFFPRHLIRNQLNELFLAWIYKEEEGGGLASEPELLEDIKQICSKYDKALLLTSPMKYVRELAKEL